MKKLLIIGLLITTVLYGIKLGYTKKVNAIESAVVYDLPYAKGASYKVVQGYGGWFSHNGIAAIDFAMPVGTPIYAARDGIVYSYKETEKEGGLLPKYKDKANYIIIKHDDNTYGCYWHLKQNGVVVKQGKVAKGELIGYSGATGFVLNPHLHFSVKSKLTYASDAYVKTKFNTSTGIRLLTTGNNYTKP